MTYWLESSGLTGHSSAESQAVSNKESKIMVGLSVCGFKEGLIGDRMDGINEAVAVYKDGALHQSRVLDKEGK